MTTPTNLEKEEMEVMMVVVEVGVVEEVDVVVEIEEIKLLRGSDYIMANYAKHKYSYKLRVMEYIFGKLAMPFVVLLLLLLLFLSFIKTRCHQSFSSLVSLSLG